MNQNVPHTWENLQHSMTFCSGFMVTTSARIVVICATFISQFLWCVSSVSCSLCVFVFLHSDQQLVHFCHSLMDQRSHLKKKKKRPPLFIPMQNVPQKTFSYIEVHYWPMDRCVKAQSAGLMYKPSFMSVLIADISRLNDVLELQTEWRWSSGHSSWMAAREATRSSINSWVQIWEAVLMQTQSEGKSLEFSNW